MKSIILFFALFAFGCTKASDEKADDTAETATPACEGALVSRDPVEVEPLTVLEGETFVFILAIYDASSVTGVTPEVLDDNCQEGVLGDPISW